RQRKLGKIIRQTRAHVGELDIGDDLAQLSLGEGEPAAQRALAAIDFHGQRQPFAPGGDVRVIQTCVDLAFGTLPFAKGPADEIAAHIDRSGKLRGWTARQSEAMAAEPALETKRDLV